MKKPRLLESLPNVECVVRARIPTTTGAEMFLYLYQNNVDNKEHLAIVFGSQIRSKSLDREIPGETEQDRLIRGAYVGRLRPGRVSSRYDNTVNGLRHRVGTTGSQRRKRESGLRNVQNATTTREDLQSTGLGILNPPSSNTSTQTPQSDHSSHLEQTHISGPTSPALSISSQNTDHDYFSSKTEAPPLAEPPLVRIHSECYTGETVWSARCDCGEQLDEAARLMSLPPHPSQSQPQAPQSSSDTCVGGVIVYLRQEGRGIGLASKLKAYNLQDLGSDTVEANLLLRHPADARSYGLATAILLDLGCGGDTGIRLLTNNPDKVWAVEGPNREVRVRERVAMVPVSWRTGGKRGVKGAELQRYLETKMGRMGHVIQEDQPVRHSGYEGSIHVPQYERENEAVEEEEDLTAGRG